MSSLVPHIPPALGLADIAIDRMRGTVVARGTAGRAPVANGTLTLRHGGLEAGTALVPGTDWRLELMLGKPTDAPAEVQMSWSVPGTDQGQTVWPVCGLRDATPYQHNISEARYCRVSGRFLCRGWGFPTPGSVTLLINDRACAHTAVRHRRSDVAQRHPWTGEQLVGWTLVGQAPHRVSGEVRFSVCSSQGCTTVTLQPGHGTMQVENDRGRWNPVWVPALSRLWRALPTVLAQAPLGLHRRLIASGRLVERWNAEPQGLWGQLRRAVADSLIDRRGLADTLWIRLKTGDLVLAAPGQDGVISRRFLLDGQYEEGFLAWTARLLSPGDTVVDAGAAFGSFSLVAARAVAPAGRVLAIEPNPATAQLLRQTLAANAHGRVVTWAGVAVADRPGRQAFADISQSNAGGSRLVEAGETAGDVAADISRLTQVSLDRTQRGQPAAQAAADVKVRVQEVQVATLDELCERHQLRDVVLLKIDIEGGELRALLGARRLLDGAFGVPPVVALEFSKLVVLHGGTSEDLFEVFASSGWSCWRLQRGKESGGPMLRVPDVAAAPEHDNLIFVPPARAGRFEASALQAVMA